MSIKKYQLFVNTAVKIGDPPFRMHTLSFDLDGVIVNPSGMENMASKKQIVGALKICMADPKMDPVPEKTPFYLGMVILNPMGHRCDVNDLIATVMDAMQGVVFKNKAWCDGVTVVRAKEGGANDLRINVAWKDELKMIDKTRGLFGEN